MCTHTAEINKDKNISAELQIGDLPTLSNTIIVRIKFSVLIGSVALSSCFIYTYLNRWG